MIATSLACMLLMAHRAQGVPSVEDLVAPALTAAGLTTLTARYDEGMLALFRQAEFTTPLYQVASQNPWQAPFLFEVFTKDIEANAEKPNEVLNVGTRYVGIGSRRTLIGDPLAKAREELKKPDAFERHLIGTRGRAEFKGRVPPEVREAAALILAASEQAREQYGLFAASILRTVVPTDAEFRELAKELDLGLKEDAKSQDFWATLRMLRAADSKYLLAGANDLLIAVQEASKLVAAVPASATYRVSVSTFFGTAEFCGGTDDVHRPGTFLSIDTGGNDTYVDNPASESASVNRSSEDQSAPWLSIVIDTQGNDKYVSNLALIDTELSAWPGRKDPGILPGPAGALFGYAFLFDLKGDDLYRSHRNGIASGRLGVAYLQDAEGNDTYDGYADSLGFGMFGAGILEDLAGNDRYSGFTQTQGVGQTAGFGALIDRGGDDEYIANDTVIDFPSAQSKEHNTSMSQGGGNGTRRDYLDAHSLAGGIGLLLDQGGDDEYSGAVFAQGIGYWEGIGLLRDRGGDDEYKAGWYAQGAAAHFAIGWLQDDGGADEYTATMNMAQGAGHDFSTGYLFDLGGNDIYTAPNLSLGAGNASGIGLFLDSAGDDRYQSSGITLGQSAESTAGTLRSRALTFGVFCDLAGKDVYPSAIEWARDATNRVSWAGHGPTPQQSQLGVFWDK